MKTTIRRIAAALLMLAIGGCEGAGVGPATAVAPVPVTATQPLPITPTQPLPITATQPLPVPGFDPGTFAPATASAEDQYCRVYARRCEAGCRAAFLSAVPGCQLDASRIADPLALGRCLVACNAGGDDQTCVGSATLDQCRCQLGCYRAANLDEATRAQARAAAACLDRAISPACR